MKYILIPLLLMSFITLALSPKQLGCTPRGVRKERILKSPHSRNGKFQNLSPTPQFTGDRNMFGTAMEFIFKSYEDVRPNSVLPAVKTDLLHLNPREDVAVWFGHSSTFLQVGGRRILIDPVFSRAASPVFFVNRAFKGTSSYAAADMPDIDYLIITHDHFDHLDYPTVKALKPRVAKIVCPLGVGEHFERWGFDMTRVVEMDWNDAAQLDSAVEVVCLPARHFSGRSFSPNQSLWASFLVKTPSLKIFAGGDGGYDTHFADIGARFGGVDLALLENGQYNEGWRHIHMLPEQVVQAGKDLQAKLVLPVHHSKFALAQHAWYEPLSRVTAAHDGSFTLLTPMMGEVVALRDSAFSFKEWWK
jgi:L-ascorbate metabolism protein UlaG (beta-lactamase superfamily)